MVKFNVDAEALFLRSMGIEPAGKGAKAWRDTILLIDCKRVNQVVRAHKHFTTKSVGECEGLAATKRVNLKEIGILGAWNGLD